MSSTSLLTKLINTIHQSKRLKYQKLLSQKQLYIAVKVWTGSSRFKKPTDIPLHSKQRVTQREQRKAPLKWKSHDSSGLILQNKYLFRTKLAERGRERQRENILLTHSPRWNLKDVNCLVQQAATMIDRFVSYGVSVVSLS